MKKIITTTCLALALIAGSAGLAAADSKCNDFNIVVVNEYIGSDGYEKEIRVFDLDYWDDEDGKWRNEATSNHDIAFSSSHTWTKNLEYVGGEQGVKVRIYYQVYDNGSWGATRTKTSSAFQCIDNDSIWITVD